MQAGNRCQRPETDQLRLAAWVPVSFLSGFFPVNGEKTLICSTCVQHGFKLTLSGGLWLLA
jgi:hypothetical protein